MSKKKNAYLLTHMWCRGYKVQLLILVTLASFAMLSVLGSNGEEAGEQGRQRRQKRRRGERPDASPASLRRPHIRRTGPRPGGEHSRAAHRS